MTFLLDGERKEASLTYRELDRQARAVAAWLQRNGLAGERAIILVPPGLPYVVSFVGCLYAGTVAVPAYPPRPNRSLARLESILEDARVAVAIAPASIQSQFRQRLGHARVGSPLRWLDVGELPEGGEPEWDEAGVGPDTLAFLQYTSGSTADPRGVMITHQNLLHNSELIRTAFGHTAQSQGVIWLPPYHDMGLIGGVLQPLYGGFPVTLMAAVAMLQRPRRWLSAIGHYRGTTSGGPDFAYDLCVREIPPDQRAGLDLSSWRVAFCGAEPIQSDTLDRFAEAFAPCGFRREAFYPCYGLAESTLIATGGEHARAPVLSVVSKPALERGRVVDAGPGDRGARTLVGCGRAFDGHRLEIVVKMVVVVFGADNFAQRAAVDAPVTLDRVPRRGECARVFDSDIDFDPFSTIDDAKALDDMQLLGVGRAERVYEGPGVEPDRVDDEGIAILIMPDGFPEPRRFYVRRMLVRQINVAHHVILRPNHHDLFWSLDEINRIDWIEQETRNAMRPAA